MKIGPIDLVFLPLLGAAISFYLLGTFLLARYRRRSRPEPDLETPVTILKPLAGSFPGLLPSLESFFRQSHRHFQIVIGVRSQEDPATAVAEELRRRYPQVDCEITIGSGPEVGPNRKVTNLYYMMAAAKHDLLIISDDDVEVEADYVARMVGAIRDPRVGVVTSPHRVRPRSLALAVDALTRATELTPSVLIAETLDRGLSFTLGASSIFRRKTLEDIGGLRSLADYLAEDYLLGARAREKGWDVRLSTEIVDLSHDFTSLGDYLGRQLRWSRTYRFCRPVGYFLSILTQGIFLGLLYVAVAEASRLSLLSLGVVAGARLLSAGVDILLAGHRRLVAWLPLVIIRDLLSMVFWAASFLGRTVRWRGQEFRLRPGGRLELAD
jgi:ceramide glucosyltransferase